MTEVIRATPLDFAVIIIYFIGILGFGAWFSRYTKSTKDFFFGGQRFSWWLIAMSCCRYGCRVVQFYEIFCCRF